MQKNTNRVLSEFEAEIEAIVQDYEAIVEKHVANYQPPSLLDISYCLSDLDFKKMQTRCLAAIERATGRESIYYEQAKSIIDTKNIDTKDDAWKQLTNLVGVTQTLLYNIRAGYIKTLEELVHGEMFCDFLEMAQYLLDNRYKDAAAVIAGSTLESHLKQLCKKKGDISVVNDEGKPKKADSINSELASAKVYSKLDQKNVTAWLDLRNNAAHGDYGSYTKEQVSLMINSVRDFIARIPA
jgi:hypothetical protein